MIKIYWIDENGKNVVSTCFNEYHANRFEESLDASGLFNSRIPF